MKMRKADSAPSTRTYRNGEDPGATLRTRPPLERMKRIYEALVANRYPNSQSLAHELEVSAQTAKRDIDFMRDRWNVPMAYDSKRHGYYLTGPLELFPGLESSHAETLTLILARKAIAVYQTISVPQCLDTSLEHCTRRLDSTERDSLQILRKAVSFRASRPDDGDPRIFETVSHALGKGRALLFYYRKPGEKSACLRKVHPYHLVAFEHRWYLFAHDTRRGEVRKFVLSRMQAPQIMEDEPFERPQDFDPQQYLEASLGIMTGAEDYEVVIEMDAWLTDVLRGRCWHHAQVWTELANGCSRLRLRLNCLEEIEQCVLSWGSHATVLGPAALVERVTSTAQRVLARYANQAV